MNLQSSEVVERLDKVPLTTIYKTTVYNLHGKHVTNKYEYAEAESSQLITKICSMACDWLVIGL